MFTAQGRRARLMASALLGAALLGGCMSAPAQPVTDASGTTTVRVVMTQSVNTALANLPVDAGMGTEHRIKIQRLTMSATGRTNQVAALLAGDCDFAIGGTNAAVDARQAGAPLEIIAGVGPLANSLTMTTTAADRAGVTGNSSPEDKIRALRGLRVAASSPGTAGYAVLLRLLESVGLRAGTDVSIVPLSEQSAITAGLANGLWDASFVALGPGEAAVVAGDAVSLGSTLGDDFPQVTGFEGVALYTTQQFAEAHPDLVEGLRATYADAARLAAEQPDQAAQILRTGSLKGLAPAIFDTSWEQVRESLDGDVSFSRGSWERFVELFNGIDEADYSDLRYEDLVPASIRSE